MVAYFLLVILVATAGFVYTIYECTNAELSVNNLKGKIPRMQTNNDIAFNTVAEASNLRAYLLYGKEQYLNEYKRLVDLNGKLEDVLISEATSEASRKLSVDTKALDGRYAEVVAKKFLPLLKAGNKDAAMEIAVNELAPLGSQLLDKVEEAKIYRVGTINQAMDDTYNGAKLVKTVAIAASVLVAILGILIGLMVARRIATPIKGLQGLMAQASKGNLMVKAVAKKG